MCSQICRGPCKNFSSSGAPTPFCSFDKIQRHLLGLLLCPSLRPLPSANPITDTAIPTPSFPSSFLFQALGGSAYDAPPSLAVGEAKGYKGPKERKEKGRCGVEGRIQVEVPWRQLFYYSSAQHGMVHPVVQAENIQTSNLNLSDEFFDGVGETCGPTINSKPLLPRACRPALLVEREKRMELRNQRRLHQLRPPPWPCFKFANLPTWQGLL
ncbi:hypothetical protein COCNU_scaffold036719G000010 [Cocos nucifera]|nr:hypothetical protein [Cocos nucifera]